MRFSFHRLKSCALLTALAALTIASSACNRSTGITDTAFVDTGAGQGYLFRITYPPLPHAWHALDEAMRAFGAQAKRELTVDREHWKPGEPEARLDLAFDVARRTSGFISVLSNGSMDGGGAHPVPIVASFNLDLASGKLVSLADLFTQPANALQILAAECRRQLLGRFDARPADPSIVGAQSASEADAARQWIDKGTQARADNYQIFLVDGLDAPAIGLTLVFAPYQIGPYAEGVQQVEVPAAVFYDLLKPEYRDAFAIDTQAAPRSGTR